MMNEAREELCNMQQMEHAKYSSLSPSTCIGGAVPCTGLQVLDPVQERHPHVTIIKDFISSLMS